MTKKIILTNCILSREDLRKLKEGMKDRYQTKSMDKIKNSEFKYVDSILVGPMQGGAGEFLSRKMFERMPNLRFIQCVFAGVDWMDFEQIPEHVKVSGNVGAYSDAMAEHVMGMILFFAKDFAGHHQRLKDRVFDTRYSIHLRGKTIGIIGAGGIGQAVAILAKCFGMNTLGVNTSGNPVPYFDRVTSTDRMDSVLKQSDFIVLSLPLTLKTFHAINRKKLNLMKNDCILVNVARGNIVDEKDVYDHLKRNPSFKFANDVWWRYPKIGEPFAQHFPFFELPNFLGTPHVSGFVPGREELAMLEAIENLLRFLKNGKFKGQMNRKDYLGLKTLTA